MHTSSTLLIMTCELGNVEIAEMLLQNGADIDKRGFKGRYEIIFQFHENYITKLQFGLNHTELH